jgi:YspA, cpYpsA-related SLOG family
MRVLVCGGRDYGRTVAERNALYEAISALRPTAIIHGGASGADSVADAWGMAYLPAETHIYAADWAKHGRAAGPIRNQQMIDEGKPDVVLAAPGGRGTADMVRRAKDAGIEVIEVTQ